MGKNLHEKEFCGRHYGRHRHRGNALYLKQTWKLYYLDSQLWKALEGEAEGKTNNLYLWREHNSSKKETANIDIDAEENETNSGSSRKKNTSCGQA